MNARDLLTKLGIGQFNATMVIQYMFIAPATTDPKSPPIMLLVKAIQRHLQALGFSVAVSGYLDDATAGALDHIVGPGWESAAWGETVRAVLAASSDRPVIPVSASYKVTSQKPPIVLPPSNPVGEYLPDLPGGLLTYAALGGAALYFLTKKRKRR